MPVKPSSVQLQRWLDSSTTTKRSGRGDEYSEGFAERLYHLCLGTLREICRHEMESPSSTLDNLKLKEEVAKLYLWGESFGPGELDEALQHLDDLREDVLELLGQIGKLLLRGTLQASFSSAVSGNPVTQDVMTE